MSVKTPEQGAPKTASKSAQRLTTVEFWQQRITRNVTEEDGREIDENLVGFFSVLREWADNAGVET